MRLGPLLRRSGVDRTGAAFVIRPAVDADARALVALRDAVAGEGELVAAVPGDRSVIEEALGLDELLRHGGLAVVVEAGGEVAGHLQLARRQGSHESHVADLGIMLDAAHRGRGLGRALMETGIDWAGAVRLRKLCLSVFPGNAAAIALYTSCGFAVEGTRRAQVHLHGSDHDVVLMGRVLSPPD